MKSIRRAAAWLVLAALIAGILSGCSKEKDPDAATTAEQTTDIQQTTTDEADLISETEPKNLDIVQTRPLNEPSVSPTYEISYTNIRLYEMGSENVWMQAIAEISNTGETNLSLDDAVFLLQNDAGKTIASKANVLAYPRILASGEKGYFYIESSIADITADTVLTLVPQVNISKTNAIKQNFTVTDTKISANALGDLTVTGTIENATEKSFDSINTLTVLYDEKNTPIGIIPSGASYALMAGEKTQLQDSAFALPSDITEDSVADFAVYAYAITAK